MSRIFISLIQPVFDIFVAIIIAVISISLRQTLTPFQRGFFCYDESLLHPYKSSTVPVIVLYCVGFSIPVVTVLIVELIIVYKKKITKSANYQRLILTKWVKLWLPILIFFFFGAALNHLLTNIAKYSLGRLRPHFLTVCQPDYTLFNCSMGFIEENVCTGNLKLIKEARVSFPSGHASMITYTMMFALIYLEVRFTWRGLLLMKPFLQTMLFCIAYYVSISRISDYKHHWSDVFAGSILGIIIALIMIYKVYTFIQNTEKSKDSHVTSTDFSAIDNTSKTPISQTTTDL